MTIILGIAWLIMGVYFMIIGESFDTIFKCFLLCSIFFLSVSVSSIRNILKDNVRLVLGNKKDLFKEDK